MTELITVETFAEYLAGRFPSLADDIEAVSQDGDISWLITAELVREVFVSRIFRRAVVEHQSGVLDLCYLTVEEMLSSGDSQVQRCVAEYVVPAVLSSAQWARETRARAGKLLAAALDIDQSGRRWRTEDVVYHERRAARSASLGVHRYSDMLYVHAYGPNADGGSGVVRPFLAVDSDIGPGALGSELAALIQDVLDSDIQESAHEVSEFLEFVGGAVWRDFYTNSRTVSIVVTGDDFRAYVSPRHKRQAGGWFGSTPGELLEVDDWRVPDALGRATLTALGVSSTTGWDARRAEP